MNPLVEVGERWYLRDLGEFNVLEKCRDYATIADVTGTVLIIIAFLWGGYILYRQYQICR